MPGTDEVTRLRARLPRLLTIVGTAVVAEAVLCYFFLSRPYFRTFFAPFAVAVLIAAVAGCGGRRRRAAARTGGSATDGDRVVA